MPLECIGTVSPGLAFSAFGEIKLPSRYENVSPIAAGATCLVLKAEDRFLDRMVAIKYMRPEMADLNRIRRFQQEARVMSSFNCVHLPVVLDFGLAAGGQPYMVMELVKGRSLADLIAEQGCIEPPLAIDIAIQILSALSHAHERNIVHRDLKAQNIMITQQEDGETLAKVVDFGLARCFESSNQLHTDAGAAVGTPLYMSPEQAKGLPADARSDIYSVGCLLFEMIAGQTPFAGDCCLETIAAHVRKQAPLLGSFVNGERVELEALEAIVAKTLEKEPSRRYQTAEDFKCALQEVQNRLSEDESHPGQRFMQTIARLDMESASFAAGQAINNVICPRLNSPQPLFPVSLKYWFYRLQKVPLAPKMVALALFPVVLFAANDFLAGISLACSGSASGQAEGSWSKQRYDILRTQVRGPDWDLFYVDKFNRQGDLVYGLPNCGDPDLGLVSEFPDLRALNLVSSAVTGGGLNQLEETLIERLDLRGHTISKEGFIAIGRMKKLQELKLDYMPLITREKMACLVPLSSIKMLSLRSTYLDHESQAEIGKIKSLEIIILDSARGLDDSTLTQFESMPNLKALSLVWVDTLSQAAVSKFKKARPDVSLHFAR